MTVRFRLLTVLTAGLLPASIALPQAIGNEAPASPDAVAVIRELTPGTTICAELTKTVDANKAKAGDRVEARTTLAVVSKGQVAIPFGTRIRGHIAEVSSRKDPPNTSILAVVFDEIELRSGGAAHLPMTLQAIKQQDATATGLPDQAYNPRFTLTPNQSTGAAPASAPATSSGGNPNTAHPAVDAGSHGAMGFVDVTFEESTDPEAGSRLSSTKKDVKLYSGSQIVLRVLAARDQSQEKQ
jgi:hypothetical protein